VENKLNQAHKTKRICHTFLSNFIWLFFFTNSGLTMRKSAKNQKSQVQTIKRTVTGKKESQDNSNINNFWKGSGWFYCQSPGPFVISYDQNQENSSLEKYICVRAFKYRPVPIDHVLHSLHALSVAVLAITANSANRVNHAKMQWPIMYSFKHAPICINKNAKMCLKALCSNKKHDP